MIDNLDATSATAPHPAWPTPVYVGRGSGVTPPDAELIFAYLTAEQMQAKIAGLTGYNHPAFSQFAAVLGHFDTTTGARTSDRPTALSVLLLQRISRDLAAVIVQRELFLSPAERIVFGDLDLSRSPSPAELTTFLQSLYRGWLDQPLAGSAETALVTTYRQAEAASGIASVGYEALLRILLQHGGLYYT